jgi:hypothetical protein
LEGSCTRDHGAVFDGVFDGSETVSDGILDLGDGVCVGAFDDQGYGFGVLNVFDVGVFFFAEGLFVD